jgi:heme exporter protein A
MSLLAEDLALHRGGRWLVRDIGFSLSPGAALLVQGHNGCGKSTLLRTLCGLRPLQAGSVSWRGRALPGGLDWLRAELAYVGHADGIRGDLTPEENLRAGLALAGETCRPEQVDAALEAVGLGPHRRQRGRALSQGQRRRAALARLWATRRRLWILDEPLAGLDADATQALADRLRAHLREGGLAVISCHTDTWTRTGLPLQHLRWD